jgi:hypothetical protein
MRFTSITACVVLAGCASAVFDPPPKIRWSHATANQQAFMKDRYACLQEAQQHRSAGTGFVSSTYGGIGTASTSSGVVTNGGLFTACMGAKGYTLDPNGRLGPPAGAAVLVH